MNNKPVGKSSELQSEERAEGLVREPGGRQGWRCPWGADGVGDVAAQWKKTKECSGLCIPTQKRKLTYPPSPRAGGYGTDDSELLLCVSLETREQSEACLPKLGFTLTSR